jgi:protein-disulfide isomerase
LETSLVPEARKSPLIPLVIAALAAVALGGVLLQGSDAPKEAATSATESSVATPEAWEQIARRDQSDPMALGEADAPVVMVAYSEFQCPFCGKFARDTQPALVEKYVEDGTLRIEWRDFPYLGPESAFAARAGRAAAAQGRFWEFERAMYADQLPPNSGGLDEEHVIGVAQDLGLDVDRFRADLASPEIARAVEEDFAQGQAIGVTGTPAFVVNGIPVIGAQPIHVFEQTIEKAAGDAGS